MTFTAGLTFSGVHNLTDTVRDNKIPYKNHACLGGFMFAMKSIKFTVMPKDVTLIADCRRYCADVVGYNNRFKVDQINWTNLSFEFEDVQSPSAFLNMYAFLCLVRYCVERPHVLETYFKLRKYMDIDHALLFCTGESDGHTFNPPMGVLFTLRDLSFDKLIFSRLKFVTASISLQSFLSHEPWFRRDMLSSHYNINPKLYEYYKTHNDNVMNVYNYLKQGTKSNVPAYRAVISNDNAF